MTERKVTRGVYLLPNLFTTLNLLAGYYAIVKIMQSVSTDKIEFSKAGAAILIAGIFDNLDGRIARLMKTTSRFGLEYDSLADLTSFCLAPALLVYTWGLTGFGRLGWLAAFLFFGCGALRLARFNAHSATGNPLYFKGLPTPVAAGLVVATVMLHPDLDAALQPERAYLVFLVYFVALLMVSNVRFRTFKHIDFVRPRGFSVMILLLVILVIVVAKPILTLFLIFAVYTSLGLVEAFLPVVAVLKVERWIRYIFGSNQPYSRRKKRVGSEQSDSYPRTKTPDEQL